MARNFLVAVRVSSLEESGWAESSILWCSLAKYSPENYHQLFPSEEVNAELLGCEADGSLLSVRSASSCKKLSL